MKMSAGALLTAGLWPGVLAAQDALAPDISFLCVNDLHYINSNCIPFFQKMVMKMRIAAAGPETRLLLVVGDVTDDGTPPQLMAMHDVIKTTALTPKYVIGNQDWTTDTDRRFFDTIYPNSINYTFEQNGWQFVGLDSTDGVKYQNTSITKATLDWVDANLPKLDKKRPMILYTHFPMGEGVTYRPKNAEDLMNRFKEHNLRAVFNGHYQGYTERTVGDYMITTGKCCSFRRDNYDGTPEKGFYICKSRDGKMSREFVEVDRRQPAPATKASI